MPLLGRRQDVQLTVVADEASDARARAARAAPKGAATVSDWRDALIRDDVDAAIIALPPALHGEAACAALTRGLHVYVEKPLATSDADARAILGAQSGTTSFAMVGFNYRFNPLYRELRARIHNGEVGRVRIVRTIFSAPAGQTTGWRGSRQAGGGVLLELAGYLAGAGHAMRRLTDLEFHRERFLTLQDRARIRAPSSIEKARPAEEK